VNLAIRDQGGSGRVLLWAHGLASSMALEDEAGLIDWTDPMAGWRLVRYDARGHGGSPGSGKASDYRLPLLADDLLGLLDHLGVERAVLGGASLGAATALHAAIAAPERVEALVLAVPPAARGARRVPGALLRTASTTVRVAGKGAFLRMAKVTVPPPILRGDLEPFARSVVAGFEQLPRDRLAGVLRAAADHDLPPDADLRRLDVPAVVFGWATDPGHPLATAEHVARVLPQAALHVAHTAADVRTWEAVVRSFVQAL
jgi:pimeloyl-ACP methyl ester carboxylesterase